MSSRIKHLPLVISAFFLYSSTQGVSREIQKPSLKRSSMVIASFSSDILFQLGIVYSIFSKTTLHPSFNHVVNFLSLSNFILAKRDFQYKKKKVNIEKELVYKNKKKIKTVLSNPPTGILKKQKREALLLKLYSWSVKYRKGLSKAKVKYAGAILRLGKAGVDTVCLLFPITSYLFSHKRQVPYSLKVTSGALMVAVISYDYFFLREENSKGNKK